MDLDEVNSIAIIGNPNTGKTNLAFSLMNKYEGKRKKYLFGYPKKVAGYKTVSTIDDLFQLKDSIIFMDEIQKFIKVYDKKANTQLMELISTFAHKKNTLIFTTQLSQFITRGVEAFIDTWAITRIDMDTLKNGSKPKRLIQRLCDIRKTDWVLDLDVGEYYEHSFKNKIGSNKIKKFKNQDIGKDWR